MNQNISTLDQSYIRQIYSIPLLSKEDEYKYACLVHDHSDTESAQQLITSHLRSVANCARNLQSYGFHLIDLIQEGTIGLMKAVKAFNPYLGNRLITYALHWIKAEMFEFILKNKLTDGR